MTKASVLGKLMCPPFGADGLKIAESREIVELMGSPPVGDEPGVIVIGPMDRANRASQDVLLKSIEEFNERYIRPVLWAHDESDVLPTILSRCLRQWSPGTAVHDEDVLYQARAVVDCMMAGDTAGVIEALKDQEPRPLLEATAQVLMEQGLGEKTLDLWERVRETLCVSNPSKLEALATFL